MLKQPRGVFAAISLLVQKISRGIGFHVHDWRTLFRSVSVAWQKGEREHFQAAGDVEECEGCTELRFVPNNPTLRVVECFKPIPYNFDGKA